MYLRLFPGWVVKVYINLCLALFPEMLKKPRGKFNLLTTLEKMEVALKHKLFSYPSKVMEYEYKIFRID